MIESLNALFGVLYSLEEQGSDLAIGCVGSNRCGLRLTMHLFAAF